MCGPQKYRVQFLKDIEVTDISESTKKAFFCFCNMDIDLDKVLFKQDWAQLHTENVMLDVSIFLSGSVYFIPCIFWIRPIPSHHTSEIWTMYFFMRILITETINAELNHS